MAECGATNEHNKEIDLRPDHIKSYKKEEKPSSMTTVLARS